MKSQLLSVTILHRHGARGPGDSETSAWNESDEVITQWKQEEFEKLTPTGVKQIQLLGQWFAKTYIKDELIREPSVFFRGSKSDRAVESGRDFVSGFNDAVGRQISPLEPTPYEVNADCYFRPWKVHLDSAKAVKAKVKTEAWNAKKEENKEFLAAMCTQLRMGEEYHQNLNKALWSTTHVSGLIECETHWPAGELGDRNALISRISTEDSLVINSLACWVWEERFVRSTFEVQMGSWIFLDMIQRAFNPSYTMNFFSGHDYTILGLMSCMRLVTNLRRPIEFGSYVIFELWDGPLGDARVTESPEGPDDVAGLQVLSSLTDSLTSAVDALLCGLTNVSSVCKSRPQSTGAEECPSKRARHLRDRVLRVILNQQPFERENNLFGVDLPRRSPPSLPELAAVRDDRAEVLVEWSMEQVKDLVDNITAALTESGGELPPGFVKPEFF